MHAPVAAVPPPHVFDFGGLRGAAGGRASTHRYGQAPAPPFREPAEGPPVASSATTLPYHSVLGQQWASTWAEGGMRGHDSHVGSASRPVGLSWCQDAHGLGEVDGEDGWHSDGGASEVELEDWEYPGLKETTGELAEQLDFTMMRLAKR